MCHVEHLWAWWSRGQVIQYPDQMRRDALVLDRSGRMAQARLRNADTVLVMVSPDADVAGLQGTGYAFIASQIKFDSYFRRVPESVKWRINAVAGRRILKRQSSGFWGFPVDNERKARTVVGLQRDSAFDTMMHTIAGFMLVVVHFELRAERGDRMLSLWGEEDYPEKQRPASDGVTLVEAARFLKYLGLHDGMTLSNGHASGLWTNIKRPDGTRSQPSAVVAGRRGQPSPARYHLDSSPIALGFEPRSQSPVAPSSPAWHGFYASP